MKAKLADFTITPNCLIFDNNLTNSEFRVLLAFKSHGYGKNKIFPSQLNVSKKLNINRRTVNKHIKALKLKGYIVVKRRGYSSSNEYILCEQKFSNEAEVLEQNVTTVENETSHQMRINRLSNNTVVNNIKEKDDFDRKTKIIEQTRKKFPFLIKRY